MTVFVITWGYSDGSGFGVIERAFKEEEEAHWVAKLLVDQDTYKTYSVHELELK
jgi:hypothetical protein